MKQYITNSEKETKLLAAKLTRDFNKGIIALYGDLGAGKTTFVQGAAYGLGIKDKILSPTFVLVRIHKLANQKTFYHIDLYRLENIEDIKSIGIDEILSSDNIVLIEWAEKLKSLPKNAVKVKIEKGKGDERLIKVG